jgi:hypothetical protein
VRHGADELPRRIARQLRIGVQRDDVLDGRQERAIADDERKAVPAPPRSSAFSSASLPRLRS